MVFFNTNSNRFWEGLESSGFLLELIERNPRSNITKILVHKKEINGLAETGNKQPTFANKPVYSPPSCNYEG